MPPTQPELLEPRTFNPNLERTLPFALTDGIEFVGPAVRRASFELPSAMRRIVG
jgi:hypothetical protein